MTHYAFADLLDELNISRVTVVGFSAGGPSTLQFALHYPDRTSAIVLVSAVFHEEKPMDFREKIIHYVIFKSDFIFWLITLKGLYFSFKKKLTELK